MQYCNICGAENSDGARFCSTCGKPVSGAGAAGGGPATLPLQSLLQGKYLVLKLLGQGGMGSVYLAQDQTVFNRLCVVKEMLPYYTTAAERQQAEQNFEREARLLATLRNPRIPQVYAYFIENNHYYLVMEWVEGENLEHCLGSRHGPLPEADVLDYGLQLASVLVYIAKQNPPVIHRDIKPANILVGDDGQIKLVDFGIAKATMSSGLSSKVSMPLGTQGYAPPEQYSGQVEPRTDVYALGATLHHLLTGRDPRNEAPFQFPPVRALAPGVSPEFEKLLADMLQLDPTLRPTAVELRARLESFLAPQAAAGTQFQPFVFRAGAIAANLHELAQACDRHWDEAAEHLYNGEFEPWLTQMNRADLAVRAGTIKRRGGDRAAGLEEFIRAIDHTMLMPALAVDQNTVDLGPVERGERRTFTVQLMNAGRGYLHGEIKNSEPWVRVSPRGFGLREGQQVPLLVTVDTGSLPEGPLTQTVFEATSNGGQAVVALKLDVTWQPRLEILPTGKLDFGAVPEGQQQPATTVFVVRNTGGGILTGQLGTSAPWIQLDQTSFSLASGADLTVTATADPNWLGLLTTQESSIRVSGANVLLEKPALIRVQKAWYVGWPRVSSWLLYGLLMLIGYLGAAVPLALGLAALLGWPLPETPVLVGLGVFLLLSPLAFVLSRQFVARLDEMEDYHHRGRLADELLPGAFSTRKLAGLTAVGLVLGVLLGWWFGHWRPDNPNLLWAVITGAAGGLAGIVLALEGGYLNRAPVSTPVNSAATVPLNPAQFTAQPAYAILRSVYLLLAGALFGLLTGVLLSGGSIRPGFGVGGALIGWLLSSESHRWLSLRVRWLLQQARLGGWVIVGSYLALSIVGLLRWHAPWTLAGYGYTVWQFTGLVSLFWLGLFGVAALTGAFAGLWVADGAGQRLDQAPRLFAGLTGVLLAVTLPIYIVMGLVTTPLHGSGHLWANFAAMLAATTGLLWLLRCRRNEVGATLARVRGVLEQGWGRVIVRLPGVLQATWHRLFPSVATRGRPHIRLPQVRLPGAARVSQWRARLASLTLGELSAEMTLPLAIGAAGVTLIVQQILAQFLAMLVVGLGTILLYALLIVVAAIVILLIVRYLRSH